jgi:hypothetical protein
MHKWATPGLDAVPPPPKPERAAVGIWLLGVAAMLAALGAGVIAFVALNPDLQRQLFPPSSPTPTAPIAVTSPSPATGPESVPPSTPRPSPSVSQAPLPAVAQAFVRLVQDPNLSYHAEVTASLRSDGSDGNVTMSIDQSGPDLAITEVQHTPGTHATSHEVIKDGVAYTRTSGTAWQRSTGGQLPTAPYAFADLTLEGIQYLGQAPHAGKTLDHILVPTSYSRLSPLGVSGTQTDCRFTNGSTEYWLHADGSPISGHVDFSCTATNGGQSVQIDVSMTIQFSKFDKPITIAVPGKFAH